MNFNMKMRIINESQNTGLDKHDIRMSSDNEQTEE